VTGCKFTCGTEKEPKTPQQTTSIIKQPVHSQETITVVDPRHPLFGRTLRLIEIENKQYLGRCCVVLDRDPIERYIPLTATDLSPVPLKTYSLFLNLDSVRQLLATYERIMLQIEGGTEDGCTDRHAGHGFEDDKADVVEWEKSSTPGPTRASLGGVDPGTTAAGVPGAGESLSRSGGADRRQGDRTGGD